MGEMYARSVLKIRRRAWGCSQSAKKNQGQRTDPRGIPAAQGAPIHFIGNVEGRDIFNGKADVIVCDGFVGNIALKTSEGVGRFVATCCASRYEPYGQGGRAAFRRALNDFRRRLDYTEYGGAPLLGVRGVCIIGHGSSNDNAIYNGIRVAQEFAKAGTNERIEQEFAGRARQSGGQHRGADATVQ